MHEVTAQAMEGIVDFTGPSGSNAGLFRLPPDFNQKQFASNWVAVGDVEQMRQVQPIVGTNKGAVGWEVWKFPNDHADSNKRNRPHKVAASKGEFVLMFRPRNVQDNVNAIYGNVSKRHLVRHQMQAIPQAPNAPLDAGGVLSPDRLAANGIRDFGDDYQMNIPQNPETSAPQVEADPASTGTAIT